MQRAVFGHRPCCLVIAMLPGLGFVMCRGWGVSAGGRSETTGARLTRAQLRALFPSCSTEREVV